MTKEIATGDEVESEVQEQVFLKFFLICFLLFWHQLLLQMLRPSFYKQF